MLKHVICPNGDHVLAEECKAGKCPQPHRCRPLSFLRACLEEREWKGLPSVTQLISGTRYAYLKIVSDYDEKPQSSIFKVLGTSAHAALDDEDGVSFTEESFTHEGVSGVTDRIEEQPNGDLFIIDYKVCGSFKVAKALGMVKVKENVLDENGNQTYFKSGAKKGQPKTRNVYALDITQADRRDWTLQLNYYRIMVEKALGVKIAKLKIHAIVRDGGTVAALSRMVSELDYYFDIDILPDETVLAYFRFKRDALLNALDQGKMPAPCNAHESWEGRKCKDPAYCPMRDTCIANGDNPYTGANTDDEEENA